MSVVKIGAPRSAYVELSKIPREVTDEDRAIYRRLISTDLTADQRRRVVEPPTTHPRQSSVLAIHWHPEFVPMELIHRRVDNMFPDRREELIIPTQHNVLESWNGYTGVEVDCFSRGFNRKVQLLFHFASQNLEQKDEVFRAMLAHTFKYRSSQLFELMDSLVESTFQDRVEKAATETWADDYLIEWVRIHVRRLRALIQEHEDVTPAEMIKNKLVRNYFDELRGTHDGRLIDHAQVFLKEVKKIVKRGFALDYFYQTEEVIEEARSLGGGVVIPHPEQFWPILLAGYDVDGIEVWNPQSFQYTEFLINVVNKENRTRRRRERPILVTMGDDCHMGEKVKDPRHQDPAKASREIGVQPIWDDLTIRKSLIVANASREKLIAEYKARLG